MNRSLWLILFGLASMAIILVVGLSFYYKIWNLSEETNILEYPFERIDVVVGDRIPLGCFIPPNWNENKFNTFKQKLKEENESLWKYCFCLNEEDCEHNQVSWDMIKDKLKNGIKVNGYCFDCALPSCVCLGEKVDYDSSGGNISLSFGKHVTSRRAIGTNTFTKISGYPSIFVVKSGEEPKLSLYAGVKLMGKKKLVGAIGALYNKSGRISTIAYMNMSCYFGKKYDCYHNCRLSGGSKEKCKSDCDCYLDLRRYDENASEICKNYCEVDFSGHSSSSKVQLCKDGCNESRERYYSTERIERDKINGNCPKEEPGEVFEREEGDTCIYCPYNYPKYDENNGICKKIVSIPEITRICENKDCVSKIKHDICENIAGSSKKEGCEKFLDFLYRVFEINAGTYKTFKIGNVTLLNPNYRGLAFAKVNLTLEERHPANSCYNIEKYQCYSSCWNEVCRRAKLGLSLEVGFKWMGNIIVKEKSTISSGTLENICDKTLTERNEEENKTSQLITMACEETCNCSTTSRLDEEDPYPLCKVFCTSRDGFYDNSEEVSDCFAGCEDASEGKEMNSTTEEYTIGYNKYTEFVIIVTQSPFIYRNLYKNIYSNLIYIVDWDSCKSEICDNADDPLTCTHSPTKYCY